MAYKVGTVLIDIKADTAKLVTGMEKAEKSIKGSITRIKRTILTLATAYASFESIKALKNMVVDTYNLADATGKLAEKLGMTAEQLSGIEYAASYADVSISKLEAAMSAMIRRTTNYLRSGTGAAATALRELGISTEYARKHFTDTNTTFLIILDRLNKMPDGFRKTAIAQDIFSKSAADVLRISSMSKTELGALLEEARKFNALIPNWAASMSAALNDTEAHIKYKFAGIKKLFSFSLLPSILAFAKTIDKWLGNAFNFGDSVKNNGEVALKVFKKIAIGAGFIKDAFIGIKLVLKVIELSFYGLATAISLAIEPAVKTLNGLIATYNRVANSWLGKKAGMHTINGYFQSSLPDNIKKVNELKKEIAGLANSLHEGRDEAEKFNIELTKNYKKIIEKDWTPVKSKNNNLLPTNKDFSSIKSNFATLHDYVNNLWGDLIKQESFLKTLKQQYISLLPPKEQIDAWYSEMKQKIELLFTDVKRKKEVLDLLEQIKNKKLENVQTKVTIDTSTFEGQLLALAKKFGIETGNVTEEQLKKVINVIIKAVKLSADVLKTVLNDMYNGIKDKYTELIDSLQQKVYTKQLQAEAYGVFGYSGYSKVTNYQADLANIQMLQTQNSMYYELSKKAKDWKEAIQDTIEVAGTTWAALGAASGMGINSVSQMIDGINFAMQGQDWAEQITGFKNFQQAYIDGVNKLEEAMRNLAKEMIDFAGDVYKSIDDYRNIYDKITGTNTYEMQKYAESLQYIGQYTALTSDSLAEFTQSILKADKGFVEGAVNISSNADELLNTDLFTNYGLAIDSLNEKFKDSLSVVADLIDKQREANETIKDYVAELRGIAGDSDYNLEYTQQQYAQALQQYYKGQIDANTLLDKAKAFQGAAGDNTNLINLLANSLEGVTEQSTEDYLQGILENTANLATVGLPDTNIEELTAPQVDTADAIQDTNSYLEKLLNMLKSPVSGFFGMTLNLLKGILNALTNIFSAIFDVAGSILGGIADAASSIMGSITDAIGGIVNGLGNVLGAAGHLVQDAATGAWNFVSDAVGAVGDVVGDIFGGIGDALGGLFAEGGFTGSGTYIDSTGERVAGIVHEGEWVAPKWMVNSFPSLFASLEKARISKSDISIPAFAVANNNVNVSINIAEIQHTNSILQSQLSIQKKMLRLMQKFDEEGIKCIS